MIGTGSFAPFRVLQAKLTDFWWFTARKPNC